LLGVWWRHFRLSATPRALSSHVVCSLACLKQDCFPVRPNRKTLPTQPTNICVGFLVYLSMFYNKRSIALRVAYLFSTAAWAGALGGLVAYAIGFLDGAHGWAGWRWIFLINGIPTIVTGVVAPFVLPNSPETAKFLTAEERENLVIIRSREAGQTASAQLMNKKDAMDALKDWKTWVISSGQYCLNSMLYSFSVFLPTIINQSGNGWTRIQV
jgi:MFS family permease